MVDFSFIVSLYVSDLHNVTISTNENLGPKEDAGLNQSPYDIILSTKFRGFLSLLVQKGALYWYSYCTLPSGCLEYRTLL